MEIYYTKNHEWVKHDDNTWAVGITQYAVSQLGDITFIELPPIGGVVKEGEVLCEIESVKAASDIYVPLSGSITEVNMSLENSPGIINSSPESDGWIVRMEISNPDEIQHLMNGEEYKKYLKEIN